MSHQVSRHTQLVEFSCFVYCYVFPYVSPATPQKSSPGTRNGAAARGRRRPRHDRGFLFSSLFTTFLTFSRNNGSCSSALLCPSNVNFMTSTACAGRRLPFTNARYSLSLSHNVAHRVQYNRRPSIAPHPVPYRQPTLQGKTPDSFLDMDETIRGYAPSKTHTSPTLKKRNKFRSPITERYVNSY